MSDPALLSYRDFRITLHELSLEVGPATVEVYAGSDPSRSVTVDYDPALFYEPRDGSNRSAMEALEAGEISDEALWLTGRRLADLALPDLAPPGGGDTIRALFLQELAAATGDAAVRIRLIVSDPALAQLPWEFMALQQREGRLQTDFLALRRRVSITRSLEAGFVPRPVGGDQGRPARIIGVVSSPSDKVQLDLTRDREALDTAVGHLNSQSAGEPFRLDWVEPPTPARLDEEAATIADIFHFAGHGVYGPDGAGVLQLESDDGTARDYPAGDLGTLLEGLGVRLAVLGACESGRHDGRNPWSSVAAALGAVGVPAIVGNQFRIPNAAASVLAARVYDLVLKGYSIDQALSQGRRSINQHGKQSPSDWGVPVLYLVNDFDGRLFEPPEEGPDPLAALRGLLAGVGGDASGAFLEWLRRKVGDPALSPFQAFVQEPDHDLLAIAPADDRPSTPLVDDPYVSPYKPFAHFTYDEAPAYRRQGMVEEALTRFRGSQALLVSGPPGAGKTSLLLAGVAPTFLDGGGIVVRTTGPVNSAAVLARDLADLGVLDLPPDPTGTDVMAAIEDARLTAPPIWIIDQAELGFDQADESRDAFIEDLRIALRAAAGGVIRLVLAVRQDQHGAALEVFSGSDDLAWKSLDVPLLSEAEAVDAILKPASLKGKGIRLAPPEFASAIARALKKDRSAIPPASVGVVCDWLWNRAVEAGEEGGWLIHEGLAAGGIDSILSGALETLLSAELGSMRMREAQVLLGSRELFRGDEWARPDEMDPVTVDPDPLLERLVQLGLLTRRRRVADEYRHASPAVQNLVRRSRPSQVRRVLEAGDTLETASLDWERGQLPTPSQLLFLAAMADGLKPDLLQSILLVRASVAHRLDPQPWLERIRHLDRDDPDVDLGDLDEVGRVVSAGTPEGRLLGLASDETVGGKAAGPYTLRAIRAPGRIDGLTAGLVAGLRNFGGGLEAAKRAGSPWRRSRYRSREIHIKAAAEEAAVAGEGVFEALGLLGKFRLRLAGWRIRFGRSGRELNTHAGRVGMAVGTGVGLVQGVTRFVVGGATGDGPWSAAFGDASFFFIRGLLLGAALAVGLMAPSLFGRIHRRWSLAGGALAFLLATVLIILMVGRSPFNRPAALGGMLAAGVLFAWLALQVSVQGGSGAGRLGRFALRTVLPAVVGLVAIQWLMQLLPAGHSGSLPIVRGPNYFFDQLFPQGGFASDRGAWAYLWRSLVNTGAVGAVMAFGVSGGRAVAMRSVEERRRLETRALPETEGDRV